MITINKKVEEEGKGVSIVVAVKRAGCIDSHVTLIMDTKQNAECALLGRWFETDNVGRPGTVLDFFPLEQYPLVSPKTGRICRSFLPYIGLKPNTLRIDTNNRYDYRLSAFKNVSKRKCKLMDYFPESRLKQITQPLNPLKSQLDNSAVIGAVSPVPVPVSVDIDIAGITLTTIMKLFKCDKYRAVDFIMQHIQGD